MSYQVIFTQGTATVAVPAGEKIAVQAYSPALVFQEVGYPNLPESQDLLSTVENTTFVSSAFTNATNVTIQAGASGAYYSVGVAPAISDDGNWQPQGAPANIADGGSMIATAANVLTGIITATPTALVAIFNCQQVQTLIWQLSGRLVIRLTSASSLWLHML
jgi:hypothetical protein